MSTQAFQTVSTQDGSLTLFHAESRQHYHNMAGAYTEALKNYVLPSAPRQRFRVKPRLRLLDACYGLGYNTWVLVQHLLEEEALSEQFQIEITAIETDRALFALMPAILSQSCFGLLNQKISNFNDDVDNFCEAVFQPENQNNCLTLSLNPERQISMQLYTRDLRQVLPSLESRYDLVYHDPFSPEKAPELWSVDLFKYYRRMLNPQGAVLTYSAAGAVRGGLQEAGFALAKTEGVGQKTGGTIAYLEAASDGSTPNLRALDETETAYLKTRAGIAFRDPMLSTSRDGIRAMRLIEQNESGRPSGESLRLKMNK